MEATINIITKYLKTYSFFLIAVLLVGCNMVDSPKLILNDPTLVEHIKKFDSIYSTKLKYNKMIEVVYYTYQDTTYYSVGYATSIDEKMPFFECEPINGKPIIVTISPMFAKVSVPDKLIRKKLKICNKDDFKDYIFFKNSIDTSNNENENNVLIPIRAVLYEQLSLELVYYPQDSLLRVDTLGFMPY